MAGRDVPMSGRRLIVEVDVEGLNVREFCRVHGVSTWLFYDLRRRHAQDGDVVLEPQSRAPRRVANRISSEVVDLIVGLRKELADGGLDAGPATIRWHLETRCPQAAMPSEATIWRGLKDTRRNYAEPGVEPKPAGKRLDAARAYLKWMFGAIIGWVLDGTEV